MPWHLAQIDSLERLISSLDCPFLGNCHQRYSVPAFFYFQGRTGTFSSNISLFFCTVHNPLQTFSINTTTPWSVSSSTHPPLLLLQFRRFKKRTSHSSIGFVDPRDAMFLERFSKRQWSKNRPRIVDIGRLCVGFFDGVVKACLDL
jgi:hypothetical protein